MSENPDEQTTEDSGRGDATGQFFSVGTPLHAVRAGYIHRRADRLLYEAALAGRYAHIIAPARSGKSSLISATAARLEAQDVNVAVLDLAQIGVRDGASDAGRWYYSVAYRLLRQLRIRFDLQAWWQDKSILSNRQRLVEFYAEVILQNEQRQIVVFIDEIQCIARLPFADQLLASVRSAHNARTTDPDFLRLTFVLLGECDPLSLVNEPELSPFNATQPVALDDFARADLDLFATELGLAPDEAQTALDRIYYWTRGQPYLTQKLARAVAREGIGGDIAGHVDRIVKAQLAGRAALHSEPQMSHIHREVLSSGAMIEPLLNLYGRLRKGVEVAADLGSPEQRRLMALGLLEVDESGDLRIRNRIYEAVFTTSWANENLPVRWRTPLVTLAAILLIALIPLWYTQWLPNSYVSVLTSAETPLPGAQSAWRSLRSFPGHTETADGLLRTFLQARAEGSDSEEEIAALAATAAELPDAGRLPQMLTAEFWDRRTLSAMREERRDSALLASLNSLVLSTPQRRNRSAMLVGDDYPLLLASTSPEESRDFVFDPGSLLMTASEGARVMQWSLGPDGLSRIEDWTMTALEISPLVRRVIVDREGTVARIGLSLNVSHPRLADLRIKLIAPSGRAVEIDAGRERASSSEDLRIPAAQIRSLIGESLLGTWSLSIRDEAIGLAGHLAGWNLTLNAQGLVEDFQRGIGIPDPVERETEQFWISDDGRYAVARTTQSDSARLWDMVFAKPIAAIAVNENEKLVGVDEGARHLVTATLDAIHVWDTGTGKRVATVPAGTASSTATITGDRRHLIVQDRSDVETRFELWNINSASRTASLVVAGSPALISVDAAGGILAVADYDRAVRVWDFRSGGMLAQIDLPLQPSRIEVDASGRLLAAVFGNAGLSVWALRDTAAPILEEYGDGRWQFAYSSSGARFVAGRPRTGFNLYESGDGRLVGPAVGGGARRAAGELLGFSSDEDIIVTGGPAGNVRFWRMPVTTSTSLAADGEHAIWAPSADSVVAAIVNPQGVAVAIGDRSGHVHFRGMDPGSGGTAAAQVEDVSFLGHNAAVRMLSAGPGGRRLASVAADNSLRIWDPVTGQPLPFITDIPGSAVDRLAFSAGGELLGVLTATRVFIMRTGDGELLAEVNLGEAHGSMAFDDGGNLYLGSNSGSVNVMRRDGAGVWSVQRMWSGDAPVNRLQVSPRGRYLVVVSGGNQARVFNLADGESGTLTLSLPDRIEDLAFSLNESRLIMRTARWAHRASVSAAGLIWLDAMLLPKSLNGARVVFGADALADGGNGNVFLLPVARDGMVQVARFGFADAVGPGLFGNMESLIDTWRKRLAMPASQNGARRTAEPGS